MKLRAFFLLAISILFTANLSAQSVTIKGKAKSYTGKTIKAYTYEDYITFTQKYAGEQYIDTSGNFLFRIPVTDTQLIFFDLETTLGYLFAAPGQEYIVLLPMYQKITIQQLLSPYFEPQQVRLLVINHDTTDLNFTLAKIDYFSGKILDKIADKKTPRDSIKEQINKLENLQVKGKFTNDYLNYNIAFLKLLLYPDRKNGIFTDYLKDKPILWNNPQYFALFNNVFQNTLDPDYAFFDINPALKALFKQDFHGLSDSLEKTLAVDSSLATLIALKGLYDLFYTRKNAEDLIINTVKNATLTLTDTSMLTIAKNIYQQITRMRIGYPPPGFSLPNKLGIKRSLKNFHGKFVYLNFCHPDLTACKQQLPMLERYYSSRPKDFEIVTIIFGLSRKEFKQFLKQNKNYKWTFLYGGDDNYLLKQYNVAAFPTYYLIYPDGTLAANPAPSPLENFEQVFSNIYKSWYRRVKQNQSRGVSVTTEK